jgi:mannose-6-phosphate isomerase-like protein (cupin superfamily)
MRIQFLAAALCTMTLPAFGQIVTPNLYISAADVAAALAKAKGLSNMTPQVLVSVPPYRALLEYRAKPTPASIHEKNDELISVIAGSGTVIVGGTLKDQTRRNETNLTGSGIDGGKTYALEQGSFLFVPAGVAHYFSGVGLDGLTIMTLYVPRQSE